jgi:hypothetical protein
MSHLENFFLEPADDPVDLGLTQNLRHCERSEAIQKYRRRKDWIATPPTEARNDVLRKSLYQIMKS